VDAGIEDRVIASYAPRAGGRGGDGGRVRHEREEAAYQRWRRALEAVPSRWRDTLIHVACIGHPPSLTQYPGIKGALGVLVRFYGLPE
jgi:hypothetical protein